MVPVLAIVGRSGSGKTLLMVKLIAALRNRGHKVATIKHCHHTFELDQEGKDSWRHRQAGASPVIISAKGRLAMMVELEGELTLEEIKDRFLTDVDIVLVEGYRSLALPKVEVVGRGKRAELASAGDPHLLAVVTGEAVQSHVPVFQPDQVQQLADFIQQRLLKD